MNSLVQEVIRRETRLRGFSAVVLALGLVLWWIALLWGNDPARAWRAVLLNFLYFTPLAAGLAVWPGIVRLSRGRWARPLEAAALPSVGFAIPSLLALAALALGSRAWAPWWNPAERPQGAWLFPPWVFTRDFLSLLLFWGVAWGHVRRPSPRSLFLVVLCFALVFSLIGFDLVMALDPLWYSALFGGYFFITGLYAGVVAWTFLSVWIMKTDAGRLHDLGRLTLAFSIMAVYLLYAQLLPIWYENLPREVRFFIPRLHGAWGVVSAMLLGLIYLGPLVALLTVRAKRSRRLLGPIVTLMLAGLWLERLWLVQPPFEPVPRIGLAELSMALAFLGALVLSRSFARDGAAAWPQFREESAGGG